MIYHGDALEYIYETPKILKQILIHQEEILQDKDKLCATKIGEVILTGSGSSYNAAVCATAFARKLLGIRVSAVYPVSLVEELETISEHALILGISQQGTSTAVIRALDMANENGISTVAVTGEHNTEIIKHADACLYVECGYEDAGATTKGFTATVMTLMLFFITLGIDMNRISVEEAKLYRERLEDVVNNTSIVLEESLPWCQKVSEELKNAKDFMIISSSGLRALILEGCLKFSETCRFPVRGFEAEEFMHGIYNAVTEGTCFLYQFPAEGYEKQRMEKLYEYYEKQSHKQFAINLLRNKEMGNSEKTLCCYFINDPEFSILEYILPQQLLFVLTSVARGINLNVPKDPDFHKYMNSKIE